MLLLLVVLTGLVATGLLAGSAAAVLAPLGYQDERGFHYGAAEAAGEL